MSYSFWRPQPWARGRLPSAPLATPLNTSFISHFVNRISAYRAYTIQTYSKRQIKRTYD